MKLNDLTESNITTRLVDQCDCEILKQVVGTKIRELDGTFRRVKDSGRREKMIHTLNALNDIVSHTLTIQRTK